MSTVTKKSIKISGSEGQSQSGVGTQTRTVPADSIVRVYSFYCSSFSGGSCILRITSNGQASDIHTFTGTGIQNFPGGLDVGPSSTISVVNSGNNTALWIGTNLTNS